MDSEFNTSKKHSHDVNTVERCQQKQTTCKISQHASGFDSQQGLLHGLHGLPWRRCSVYRFFRRALQEMDSMELVDGTPHAPGPSFVSSELTTCFSLFFSFFFTLPAFQLPICNQAELVAAAPSHPDSTADGRQAAPLAVETDAA